MPLRSAPRSTITWQNAGSSIHGDLDTIRGGTAAFRTATTASLNALRADQNDPRRDMNERFDRVDKGFREMRGKFDATAAGQQRIVELLEGLAGGA